MAMIACKECDHKVSDRAVSCPNCGAPLANGAPVQHRDERRGWQFLGGLILLGVLGAVATVLWPLVRSWPSLSAGTFPALSRPDHASAVLPSAGTGAARGGSNGAASNGTATVYQTTAEQLYLDYNANGVATQTRIGAGGVRVSGTIAAIEEDAAGHPVVKLDTRQAHSADMVLNDDQTATAAQLSKGQQVDIQCDTMHGIDGLPVGGQCALALVTAPALAAAPAGIASPAVAVSPAARTVAPAAIAPRASDKSLSSKTIRTKASRSAAMHATPVTERADPQNPPSSDAAPVDSPPEPVPVPVVATLPVAASTTAAATTAAAQAAAAPQAAAAAQSAVAAQPSAAPTVDAGAAQAAAAPPAPDDLATVRNSDPAAAEHIASYCAKSSAATSASYTAACRREEKDAWTRLILNHEFPSLDAESRSKCDEPPFPDSYTAKETCARYQLSKAPTSAR